MVVARSWLGEEQGVIFGVQSFNFTDGKSPGDWLHNAVNVVSTIELFT